MNVLRHATLDDLNSVYDIINKRIKWMDEKNIYQWNKTDYWGRYPKTYYENLVKQKELYVYLVNDEIVGVFALFTSDIRWQKIKEKDAYYVHHFATKLGHKGIGEIILMDIIKYAKSMHKIALRLDCAVDNVFLNKYYESLGFIYMGLCDDRLYHGKCRELIL